MKLSQMQDLGGCRAVVRSVAKVDGLVSLYLSKPTGTATLVRTKDYIADPKEDGYRSVHLVYRYCGVSQGGAFDGLQIEIQIRSRLQHAWATAVETIDTFTKQALKSNIGSDQWKRFFALMGTVIALRERRPIVPGTPPKRKELVAELAPLCAALNIPNVFYGLSTGVQMTPPPGGGRTRRHYILILDSQKRQTGSVGFDSDEAAADEYIKLETENISNPHIQTVMVSLDSVAALRTAYPNYYLDTTQFCKVVHNVIG